MASPVSIYLRDLRMRIGMTQLDLAHSIGYEQAYVSAIELGIKNPSEEFLEKLTRAIALSEGDLQELALALKASRRRFTLPPEAPPKTFRFCNDLWDKLDQLHPAILDAMHVLLSTGDQLAERPRHQPDRLRRRTKQESPM